MRLKEEYSVECVCGARLISDTRDLMCPKCQRVIRVDWGYTEAPRKEPKEPNEAPR